MIKYSNYNFGFSKTSRCICACIYCVFENGVRLCTTKHWKNSFWICWKNEDLKNNSNTSESPGNQTIRKTALIREWFSTNFWIFKSSRCICTCTLCLICICSFAFLWWKMPMFWRAGRRKGGKPLPLAFQYLIFMV